MPLFPLPERPPPRMSPGAGTRYRFARYKPRTRVLCAECIRLIHALGANVAPHPSPVRWRVRRDEEVIDLCEQHKTMLEAE